MVIHVSFRKVSKSKSSPSSAEKGSVREAAPGTPQRPSKRRIQPSSSSSSRSTAAGIRTILILSIFVISLLSSSLFCYGLSASSSSSSHRRIGHRHRHQHHHHHQQQQQHGAPRKLASTTFRSVSVGSTCTSSASSSTSTSSSTSLSAVSSTYTAVLDGSEWTSVQRHLGGSDAVASKHQRQRQPRRQTRNNDKEPNVGLLTIVTGTLQSTDADDNVDMIKGRVVAVQALKEAENNTNDDDDPSSKQQQQRPVQYLSTNVAVYSDSIAAIPDLVSDRQAAATYASSVSWHTAWQQAVAVNRIGGNGSDSDSATDTGSVDSDNISMPINAVVVGGSAYAVAAAAALAALGATVTVVSTGTPKLDQMNANMNTAIAALPPATGELQVSFCNVLGKFDLLLDTLGNERDDAISDNDVGSSVLRFLKDRHDCHSYTSTVTAQQAIVNRQGVLWGPGKAKQHKQEQQPSSTSRNSFVPPEHLGRTVQTILQAGVVAPGSDKGKDGLIVRDWSLPDYWELVTWPRDSAGGANVRYGFPVPDDLSLVFEDGADGSDSDYVGADDDESSDMTNMISAPPLRAGRIEEETMQPSETPEGSNPYILNVVGVQGLQKHVIESERDCLLFLSAPFCRTCRYLQPQYQRMARMGTEEWDGAVTFAKADAGGVIGKELGRALKVDAVPSFLLFRKGRLYGEPLSISRLPSRKLDLAVDFMKSGKPWDEQALREVDQESKKNPRRPPKP